MSPHCAMRCRCEPPIVQRTGRRLRLRPGRRDAAHRLVGTPPTLRQEPQDVRCARLFAGLRAAQGLGAPAPAPACPAGSVRRWIGCSARRTPLPCRATPPGTGSYDCRRHDTTQKGWEQRAPKDLDPRARRRGSGSGRRSAVRHQAIRMLTGTAAPPKPRAAGSLQWARFHSWPRVVVRSSVQVRRSPWMSGDAANARRAEGN